MHRLRLLNCVLEIEKGPIHPPSWSIDPYSWGGVGRRAGSSTTLPHEQGAGSTVRRLFSRGKTILNWPCLSQEPSCGRGRGPLFVVGMGLREPTTLLGHFWAVALLTAQPRAHVPPPNPETWAASRLFEPVSQRITKRYGTNWDNAFRL